MARYARICQSEVFLSHSNHLLDALHQIHTPSGSRYYTSIIRQPSEGAIHPLAKNIRWV